MKYSVMIVFQNVQVCRGRSFLVESCFHISIRVVSIVSDCKLKKRICEADDRRPWQSCERQSQHFIQAFLCNSLSALIPSWTRFRLLSPITLSQRTVYLLHTLLSFSLTFCLHYILFKLFSFWSLVFGL